MADFGDGENRAGSVADHLVNTNLDGAVAALGDGGRLDGGLDLDPLTLPVAADRVVPDDPAALRVGALLEG